jgi:tetrahedral aminopeptidase
LLKHNNMNDILPFLKKMISLPGLSGHETAVRSLIEETWRPLVDEISISKLGSLHGLHRGEGPEPRPSLLIAAHMDAVGFMVTTIVDGFLRFTEIGGVDPRLLPGQLVTVHAREDLPGVVVQPPPRLIPSDKRDGPVQQEYLFIDVGLTEEEVNELIRPGDIISFAQEPLETGGETLTGHSLDNRASVAALTLCLEELNKRPHYWDVWAVATSQEEETLGGALTSAFFIQPQIAVAVDVTFASSPGSPSHKTYPLGEGPALGWGPNIHPALYKSFKELAERLEIPYRMDVMPRHSGTDAMALQVVREGIPCMVVSIPLRYMHSPVEMVAVKDIKRAGRLLAEFCAYIGADYLDSITWGD